MINIVTIPTLIHTQAVRRQPVVVLVKEMPRWQFYAGGILSFDPEDAAELEDLSVQDLNHALLAVGYR